MTTLAARMAALADQLEAQEAHGGYADGLAHAADRIRAELADDGPQTVWAVHATEYEDNGVRAILTTRELAEQHRAQLDKHDEYTDHGVEEYDIVDHLPRLVRVQYRRVHVLPDGTVHNATSSAREEWDYDYVPSVEVKRDAYGTDVTVNDENAELLLRQHVEAVLAEYAAEQQWAADRLREVTGQAWTPREPARKASACYDAPWGRVHYRASCRCPR